MTEATVNTSPLQQVHLDAGARMTDFAGWSMPLRYRGDLAEHFAVRERAGMFDLSHMGQIEISGPQSAQAMDYTFVSAVSGLRPGRARYTMIVDSAGGILDDLIVYRLADDEFLVIANAANRITVLDAITNRSREFDTAVVDRTHHRALIAVQGPNSATILDPLLQADLSELRYFSATQTYMNNVPVLVARTGYTGEDGFELSLPAGSAPWAWRTVAEAGAAMVEPCGLAARDTLRMEAGMPLYGQELTADLTPYEVGMGRMVHGERDFVGSTALARRAQEEPRSHLTALTGTGRRAARTGYRVLDGDTPVGEVTSGALSPTLGYPIAMARTTQAYRPGDTLGIDVRGSLQEMTVAELPFYKRQS